jgi:POT family proton-dependent oligopeptide transporter
MVESSAKRNFGTKMIKTLQRMPKGVTPLYFIQAFSTFSFAILYSSLSLYITKQLGLSNTGSNSIVGLFLAFNYALHLLGGIMGGRYLSNRTLFFITTILQSVGIIFLVFSHASMLYIGLSLFLVGCGLNTTCYNTMLTQRFNPDDSRREKAFFLSYSAMNVGFFAGYIISGFYDYSNQYQQIFYASLITNLITLLLMAFSWADLADKDTLLQELKNSTSQRLRCLIGIAGTLILVPFLNMCFNNASFSNGMVMGLSIIMLFVILFLGQKQKIKADKQKIMAYLILTATSIVFWMIYFTGPMGVTIFIKNNVDKHILNYELATQWILNINAIVIIVGAPIMVLVINKLQSKGFNFSVSMQFVWAFLILALSFFFLAFGVMFSDNNGYSSIYWVILHLVGQSIAELLIGPVGYAMIGRIAPARLQGVLMGTWMMVSGVSASLSSYFSNEMMKTDSIDPLSTNADYLHVFNQLGTWALIGGVFLYFISGKIRNFIDNANDPESTIIETVSV